MEKTQFFLSNIIMDTILVSVPHCSLRIKYNSLMKALGSLWLKKLSFYIRIKYNKLQWLRCLKAFFFINVRHVAVHDYLQQFYINFFLQLTVPYRSLLRIFIDKMVVRSYSASYNSILKKGFKISAIAVCSGYVEYE